MFKVPSCQLEIRASNFRVVSPNEKACIEGFEFIGWGSHCNAYPYAYLNVAAAIGMRKEEIDQFVRILDKALAEMKKRKIPKEAEASNGCENGDRVLDK